MLIKKNSCLIFVLLLFIGARNFCYAQSSLVTGLAGQLNDYSQQNFQEKIFVHTDKSFYVCGEILWFKLYNVDAYLNRPATISKVAYAELLNKEHKPVVQASIELKEGAGIGSFMLPFSLNSGVYILRVYTNWMKNFSPEFFFEKPITVVNTLKKLPVLVSDSISYGIQFFPEGGNLVNGLESKVAFHATDQTGAGVVCNGIIVNQNNDTITSFKTFQFGMGNFGFTPVKGHTYQAIVQTVTGQTITKELPASYETGYVMKLDFPSKETIRVSVQSNVKNDEPVFLLVHTRQVSRQEQTKTFVNGVAEFIINKKDLGEGISHFTLFNNKRQPVCERLYFRKPEDKLSIEMTINESEYALRKKVNIRVTVWDLNHSPMKADLSLSVFRMDSLQVMEDEDILSYLWLSSELRGSIESPSYYFHSNEDAEKAADNLMLTQGWSRFKWENVLSGRNPVHRFLPEYEGPVVTGRIKERVSGSPAKNITGYLSIPGERFVLRTNTSDQNGNVFFNLNKFYGSTNLIVQARDKAGESYMVDINSPYAENFSSRKYPPLSISEKWQDQLVSYSVGTQVENTYVREKKQQFFLPLTDTTVFYGRPDKTYQLDDYTRFITLEEVMREYVAEVRVRKQQDHFIYRVKNDPYNVFFENEPLILLDGLPVFDLRKLMEFDPLKIKKLDLLTRKYFSGSNGVDGIVSYSTYKGNLDGFQPDPNALVLEYPGLQPEREFYSPLYETQAQFESPLPDFRNVLFWSPHLNVNKDGSAELGFYTSDRPGKYAVIVQGLNANGLAGSKTAFFTVTK